MRQSVQAGSATVPEVSHPRLRVRLFRARRALMGSVGISVCRRGPGLGLGRWRAKGERPPSRSRALEAWRQASSWGRRSGPHPVSPAHPSPVMASGTDIIGKLRLEIERCPPQPDSQPLFPCPPPRPVVISSLHRPPFLSLRKTKLQIRSDQSLSRVRLFATP